MRLFEGTEFDRPPRCENCGRLEEVCDCPEPPPTIAPPSQQSAIIRLEKRKRGKWISSIRGLDPAGDHLQQLLTMLKNNCGAGGTIRDEVIEIQGDHVDKIKNLLKNQGYKIKP